MQIEIPKADHLEQKVFSVSNEKAFQEIALEIFALQFQHNPVYQAYCKAIGKTPAAVQSLSQIPFLPIQFFKTHAIKTGQFEPELVFQSSGTTGLQSSFHFVKKTSLYQESFLRCFEQFFGKPDQFCILGLLPSYLEKGNSSLVFMVNDLIQRSGHPSSGFFLHDRKGLATLLAELEKAKQPTLVFGVTYALLDFAAEYPLPLQHTRLIETGGMKGRKNELAKPALYDILQTAFSLDTIYSEYGMTELLSQAYAANGRYKTPPWMKLFFRDETDPLSFASLRTGAVNVIDLANLYSCAFIATEDLGRQHTDGSFEILGRMDNSAIRGCSQLAL